jgi:hypothetical protein
MAHDCWPLPGYVECFRPNDLINLESGYLDLTVVPKSKPLTDADIHKCQDNYLFLITGR